MIQKKIQKKMSAQQSNNGMSGLSTVKLMKTENLTDVSFSLVLLAITTLTTII